MSVLRRTATGVVAALAVVITGPALTASAAGNPHHFHFKTIERISGAKLQACRLHTTAKGPWKVKLRVDAKKASGMVSAGAQATRNGTPIGTMWSSGFVHKGHRSAIGTVSLPRGAAYRVIAGMGNGGMGGSRDLKVSDLRRCH